MSASRIVVVGASLAGLRAVESVREQCFSGEVVVVGDEQHAPYDRPPLSKRVLKGSLEPDRTQLRVAAEGGVDGLNISWELGCAAASVDVAARTVDLSDGRTLPYDGLVVATGAQPRRLRGWDDVSGVHVLRTLDDAVRLRDALAASTSRLVVVGAGFIGAEVAATARGLGTDVTVVDALAAPMVRALGPQIAGVCADLHRDHGVDLRMSTGVADLVVDDERAVRAVRGVRTSDGDEIAADVVVLGLGVTPNTSWLASSGLDIEDGLLCDETLRAADGIVAAGDVARWPNARFGRTMRLEHWDNAQASGTHAARTLVADLDGRAGSRYQPVPWFWTDQFDRKMQLAGHPDSSDTVEIVEGSTEERKFLALYRSGDRVTGAFGMNMPARVLHWQREMADYPVLGIGV